jgi:hypothetical protein
MTTALNRPIGHLTDPGYRMGNSERGSKILAAKGFKWTDNDGWLTLDGKWVRNHWPDLSREGFLSKEHRIRYVSKLRWDQIKGLTTRDGFHIDLFADALKQNARLGLNTEIEVKDPNATSARHFQSLADAATQAYGDNWRKHTIVKTLTNLNGYNAALTRLKAAKDVGFETLILLRDSDIERTSFPSYVDYVRGNKFAMATSQNGYPVLFNNDTTGPLPRLRKTIIPDTGRHLYLRDGSVALVLADFTLWFHENVERIDNKIWDEWGWAVRAVRGQTSGYSNHASGTAIDINATMHPLAKRWTFNAAQYAKIRAQIRTYDGCLRHGIDYRTRPDEMHVEINKALKDVEAVARRVAQTPRGQRILRANPGLFEVVMQGQQPLPPKPVQPVPPKKPTKASQVLRVGSKGAAVRALQAGLNKTFPAYSHLDVDGQFGPKTKAVVMEFQRRSKFKAGDVNGIVGPATRKALNKNGVRF